MAEESLHVCFQNTQGLRTKTDIFHHNLLSSDYDIICLTETWLNSSIFSSELFNSNYLVYRRDRETSASPKQDGGGSLIAVKTIYHSKRRQELESEAEDIWVSIETNKNEHVLVCCVYIPPNCNYSLSCFTNKLMSLENVIEESAALIVGDFNLTSVSWLSTPNEKYLEPFQTGNRFSDIVDTFSYQGLMQFNNINNINDKVLDLILCNKNIVINLQQANDCLVYENVHHKALEFLLRVSPRKPLGSTNINIKSFNKANFDLINNYLSKINWEHSLCGSNIDLIVETFYDKINKSIQEFVPVRKIKGRYPVYFGHENIQKITEKNKLHKKYKRYNNMNTYNRFSELRTLSKHLIRRDYRNYIENVEQEITTNSKKFWNFISSKRKNNSYIPHSVKFNNDRANGGLEMANLFANYFSGVLVPSQCTSNAQTLTYNDKIEPVTEDQVSEIIKNLNINKCAGPDGIPPLFVKKCRESLIKPLSIIFSLSLSTGIFPKKWKTSEVTPIFKSGDKDDVQNYRPISKLCVFGKMLEKIVYNLIMPCVKNTILEEQHGFFPGRSLESNLLCFSNFVSENIDSNHQVDAVYTDFSKAFDKIDHQLLLERLAEVGVCSALVGWSQSYISDRQSRVSVSGYNSNFFNVTSGVPQGSHLGPLFFIIYINNIKKCFKHCNILLYADDLKIYRRIEVPGDCLGMQEDVDRLRVFCLENQLFLNVAKCCNITFTKKINKIEFPYKVGGINLRRVREVKDLGVTLDEKWTFKIHFEKMINACNKMVGFINRATKDFNKPETLISLYFAFVHNKVLFGSVIWNPHYDVHTTRIERIQNRFLRFLAFKTHTTIENHNYHPIRTQYRILSLANRRTVADLCILYKLVNSIMDSPYPLSKINFRVPNRCLRNSDLFSVPYSRTNTGQHSPLLRMQHAFNLYCSDLDIFSVPLPKFKKYLKNALL